MLDDLAPYDAVTGQLQGVAIVHDEDGILGYAGLFRQTGMGAQVDRFAMHGHESLGFDDGQHQLEFFGTRMTGYMDLGPALVVDIATHLGKQVDDAGDRLLVAGNGCRTDDDRVARFDADGLMFAVCDACKRAQGLTLGPGAHDHHLLGRDAIELVGVDQVVVRDAQVMQLAGDIGVLDHGTPGNDHLALVFHGCVADLLQPVDMAGEAGDDNAALGVCDDAAKRLAHRSL